VSQLRPYTMRNKLTSPRNFAIRMLKNLKQVTLGMLRGGGVFRMVARSRWRQERLLILCYHGTSLEDEHEWRPSLYIHPQKLEARLRVLKQGNFSVLPLGEGLKRLEAGTLPRASVALTFDDGTYDFYRQAYPLLRKYGLPATVYQTTYYTTLQRPVFNLICSYMLWKRRDAIIADGASVGLPGPLDPRTEAGRYAIVRRLIESLTEKTGLEKDEIAARLAELLRIDYAALKAKRILQLMNTAELQEIAKNGIDLELHTHRHRTPEDEALFRKEIEDNRAFVRQFTSTNPVHFCYPSGIYRPQFLSWLRKESVVSATTCDAGLVARGGESLLLPRYVDHQRRTQLDFESWITGVGEFLAMNRRASQKAVPNYAVEKSTPASD
jgi:peptidoglycan/xylan/chitin deacetylase (PgdA/CDA1 family)